MIEADRRRDDIIALKMPSFEGPYETDEIAKNGVSVADLMASIADKKPKIAILMLDACRSLIAGDRGRAGNQTRAQRPAAGLLPTKDLAAGSIVVFSASFGETAIESFGFSDHRRNSLFTEVVRSELQRPGQTLIELAQRVSRMVRAFALSGRPPAGARIFRESRASTTISPWSIRSAPNASRSPNSNAKALRSTGRRSASSPNARRWSGIAAASTIARPPSSRAAPSSA